MKEKPRRETKLGTCRNCKHSYYHLTARKFRQLTKCPLCGVRGWHDFKR